MQQELAHEILRALCDHPEVTTKQEFQRLANTIYRKYKTRETLPAHVLVYAYQDGLAQGIYPRDRRVFKLLRKRAVRSLSGVSVISLLTKFWGCPGKCVFCPTFENLPKSYVPNEPAVMRAELNDFDPVRQIQNRLRSLESTGHSIAKCDVRVIGGTWSVYPKEYQEAVIRGIYDGHSTYSVARTHIEASEE